MYLDRHRYRCKIETNIKIFDGTIMDNYKVNVNGYIRVYIYKKTFALHRLIALTFLENFENKEQVNHKDGNKLNNYIKNL